MDIRYRGKIIGAAALLALLTGPAGEARGDSLAQLYAAARETATFVQPPATEVVAAEELFATLSAGKDGADAAARQQGFELLATREGDTDFRVLREAGDKRRGRGFYLFRQGTAWPAALMMPHAFTDEDTGRIGLRLMLEGRIAAAAWNTVRRRPAAGGSAAVNQDLAHLPASGFTAFTRAVARTRPNGLLLQLHGFAEKRKGKTLTAAAVVSSGTATPSVKARTFTACLRRETGREILLYPDGPEDLGGTTNVSGRIVRGLGQDGFIHLELARSYRRELRDQPDKRQQLLRCLEETAAL